jgi:hypothetical protein
MGRATGREPGLVVEDGLAVALTLPGIHNLSA